MTDAARAVSAAFGWRSFSVYSGSIDFTIPDPAGQVVGSATIRRASSVGGWLVDVKIGQDHGIVVYGVGYHPVDPVEATRIALRSPLELAQRLATIAGNTPPSGPPSLA